MTDRPGRSFPHPPPAEEARRTADLVEPAEGSGRGAVVDEGFLDGSPVDERRQLPRR